MVAPGGRSIPWITPGEVVSTDPDNRLINVKPDGTDRILHGVYVATDPGSYSFPRKHDRCLVASVGANAYYLGKLEYGFADKTVRDRLKDKETGIGIFIKKIFEGEIFLSNVLKRAWLSINNSGDFSLMNGLQEGLKYFRSFRFLRLKGMFVHVLGNMSSFKIGSVARDIPTTGKQIIPSDFGPTIPAIEAVIELLFGGLKLARFHIGHVKNALGVDEPGSWGARLRAILEVANPTGVPIAALKMDEAGNVELASSIATIMLNAATLIQLGGIGATDPVIKGTSYTTAESAFLGALQTYCTAIAKAGAAHAAIVPATMVSNGAFITALTAATVPLATAVSTFAGALAGTLSVKTMTV